MAQAQLRSDSADADSDAHRAAQLAARQAIPETEIAPQRGWPTLELAELWKYRDLVFNLTLRNVKVRYKQTVLGVVWAVLQPVLWMVVFVVFLKQHVGASAGTGAVPYPIFVLTGLLPWMFFQTAVTSAANSVVSSEGLVTKVFFPRLAIPLAAVAAALVDLVIAMVVLAVVMIAYGTTPGASVVLLPAAVLLLVVAAIGIGTLIAALTVSYRDFRHAVAFGLQIWMLATVTIYDGPAAGAAGDLGRLSRLNPMTAPIDFFRAVTLGLPIRWNSVLAASGVHVALCLAGLLYFRHVEDSFADVI